MKRPTKEVFTGVFGNIHYERYAEHLNKYIDHLEFQLKEIEESNYFILRNGYEILQSDEYLGMDCKWYKCENWGMKYDDKKHVAHRRTFKDHIKFKSH